MNETILNITNYPLFNTSTYNTGCIDEIAKVTEQMTKFKLLVYQTYDYRLGIALIILFLLINLRIYLTNRKPKWITETDIGKIIDDKLDLVLILLSACILGLFYLV